MENQEILKNFLIQIDEISEILVSIVISFDGSEENISSFASFGQTIDRIYGVAGMLDYNDFSNYLGNMKELTYKCSQSRNQEAVGKTLALMRECIIHLKNFSNLLKNSGNVDECNPKFVIAGKKASEIISQYLGDIKQGSIIYEDVCDYLLIFERSRRLEKSFKQSNKAYIPIPYFTNLYDTFKKELFNIQRKISGIIIDLDTTYRVWPEIIQESHLRRPAVPIFLISQDEEKLKKVNQDALGVSGLISSSSFDNIEIEMKKILGCTEHLKNSHAVSNINISSIDSSEFGLDGAYMPISISAFKLGLKTPFDLYVKLQKNKYIKIIHKNDSFDEDILRGHIEKGINAYYVLNKDYVQYIDFFKEEIRKLQVGLDQNFHENKIKFLDFGSEVASYIDEWGIDSKKIEMAKVFVEKSGQMITEMSKEDLSVNSFLQEIESLEHAVSVCMMGGLFLNKMGAKEEVYQDITLACMFHDIGLSGCSSAIRSEDESLMTDEEKEIYHDHPAEGAKVLKRLKFKTAIVEAIAHHHIRPQNKGFPKFEGGRAFKINPIAELIRLSETLIHVTRMSKRNLLDDDPITYFKNNHLNEFSSIISEAFLDVFGI